MSEGEDLMQAFVNEFVGTARRERKADSLPDMGDYGLSGCRAQALRLLLVGDTGEECKAIVVRIGRGQAHEMEEYVSHALFWIGKTIEPGSGELLV